jgi:hypothetical protein
MPRLCVRDRVSIPHSWRLAAIAVQFVLNYEEGAENSVLDGADASETSCRK